MTLARVVLPEPFSPTSATTSPPQLQRDAAEGVGTARSLVRGPVRAPEDHGREQAHGPGGPAAGGGAAPVRGRSGRRVGEVHVPDLDPLEAAGGGRPRAGGLQGGQEAGEGLQVLDQERGLVQLPPARAIPWSWPPSWNPATPAAPAAARPRWPVVISQIRTPIMSPPATALPAEPRSASPARRRRCRRRGRGAPR